MQLTGQMSLNLLMFIKWSIIIDFPFLSEQNRTKYFVRYNVSERQPSTRLSYRTYTTRSVLSAWLCGIGEMCHYFWWLVRHVCSMCFSQGISGVLVRSLLRRREFWLRDRRRRISIDLRHKSSRKKINLIPVKVFFLDVFLS